MRNNYLVQFLANLLRCIWLFFPSLLFVALALICLTQLGQGKDILIAFTETKGSPGNNLLTKFIFLVAIIFWVYVSWYASRMVAYIKTSQRTDWNRMELRFLHRFPRIIGYSCLLVIVLALLTLFDQLTWLTAQPFLFLIAGMILLWLADRQMIRLSGFAREGRMLKALLLTAAILVPLLLIIFSYSGLFRKPFFIILLILILLLVYMLYINLRRHRMQELERRSARITQVHYHGWRKYADKLMAFLHLPKEERGYFAAFNLICLVGLSAYLSVVLFMGAGAFVGPLPFMLLAFTVLMGFGNIVSGLSCKIGLNLHFFIFILAAFLPTPDHHRVRNEKLSTRNVRPDIYRHRQDLSEYLNRWLRDRPEIDTMNSYPMYVVLANGGASRSAYWVASVLGRLEDSSIRRGSTRFSRQLFCLSGTSGGGVGIATYYNMLMHQQEKAPTVGFETAARNYLRQDFLTYTMGRMLGADFFNYIPVLNLLIPDEDRAEALEQAFERARDDSYYYVGFDSTWFDEAITLKGRQHNLPILFINTTRVKDGSPGVVSNISLSPEIFNRRVDVLGLLQQDKTIRMSTAAILGARFPFISPAGRIDSYRPPRDSTKPGDTLRANYFVDGGYFDNSGAGVVQEMIRNMFQVMSASKDSILRNRFSKISLRVIHITNSPQGTVPLVPIGPFKNDVLAPLLTIIGAYDMQTTVNDRRIITYLKDIKATYYPIHLYNDLEIRSDTLSNGPYAMNWFMSDSVRHQIDSRLKSQPRLEALLLRGTAQ
ncbi:hypothetical protein [Flavihumibacter solisilvae]|uniref:PNPLA domain-containing protein n=1 Tax=Flavihumibacter solisilvae TaxID=1349421 RepID=A0A0C1IXK9_9BACT|nr:hypothetical protein [Flavihumibacter solisilvae]KIC95194.1 hypothetical protein OI18_07770 [Flavihumibacter solisilvae]